MEVEAEGVEAGRKPPLPVADEGGCRPNEATSAGSLRGFLRDYAELQDRKAPWSWKRAYPHRSDTPACSH